MLGFSLECLSCCVWLLMRPRKGHVRWQAFCSNGGTVGQGFRHKAPLRQRLLAQQTHTNRTTPPGETRSPGAGGAPAASAGVWTQGRHVERVLAGTVRRPPHGHEPPHGGHRHRTATAVRRVAGWRRRVRGQCQPARWVICKALLDPGAEPIPAAHWPQATGRSGSTTGPCRLLPSGPAMLPTTCWRVKASPCRATDTRPRRKGPQRPPGGRSRWPKAAPVLMAQTDASPGA